MRVWQVRRLGQRPVGAFGDAQRSGEPRQRPVGAFGDAQRSGEPWPQREARGVATEQRQQNNAHRTQWDERNAQILVLNVC